MTDGAIAVGSPPGTSRASVWLQSLRLYSVTASVVPVLLGIAWAWPARDDRAWLGVLALLGAVALHLGTNLANDLGDYRSGVDHVGVSEGSGVLTRGLLSPAEVARAAYLLFALGALLGLPVAWLRGPPVWALGLAGLLGGWGYTLGPRYKYFGLGDLCVFLLMGPLLVLGGALAITGRWDFHVAAAAVPIGCWVVIILHVNNLRDREADAEAGIHTVARALGRRGSLGYLAALMAASFVALGGCCALGWLPLPALAGLAAAPAAVGLWRRAARARTAEELRAASLVEAAAKLHLTSGLLTVAGIAASRLWH